MEINTEASQRFHDAKWDRRLNDIGWGLLLMLTGAIWLVPPTYLPAGAWFFGVAAILLGVNVARYVKHIAVSGFSVALGIAALVAALSQMWRTDPPLVAVFLLVIGASLVAKPMWTRTV